MQLRFSFCNADSSKQRQQQQKQQLKGKSSRRCQPTWRGTRVAISLCLCLCLCLCVPQRTGSLAAFGSALAKSVYKIIAYGKVATFESKKGNYGWHMTWIDALNRVSDSEIS